MIKGDRVDFQGVGRVVDIFLDPYHMGTKYGHKSVTIKILLSEKPNDDFLVTVPLVCVTSLEERAEEKHAKASGS